MFKLFKLLITFHGSQIWSFHETSFGNYYRTLQRPNQSESSDDSEGEDSSDDQDSHYPTPSVARGLSNRKLKLFLIDIEESGGLDICSFTHIFNAKQDFYGEPDSAQRTKFKNKFRSLKSYSPEDYQLVQNKRGVKSCRLSSPKPQVAWSPERAKKPSKSRSKSAKMSSTPPGSRAIFLPGSFRSTPTPPSRHSLWWLWRHHGGLPAWGRRGYKHRSGASRKESWGFRLQPHGGWTQELCTQLL